MEQIDFHSSMKVPTCQLFITDFQPPELWNNKFLLFRPHGLWHLVMAALENEYTNQRESHLWARLLLWGSKRQKFHTERQLGNQIENLSPLSHKLILQIKKLKPRDVVGLYRSHWAIWSEQRVKVRSFDCHSPMPNFHAHFTLSFSYLDISSNLWHLKSRDEMPGIFHGAVRMQGPTNICQQ